jgi:imidazolonepropionase-like amidohydrolase
MSQARVFRGATVHTADDPAVLPGGEVVVRDGRIAEVRAAPGPVPDDAEVLDLAGAHLCPGFVDPHVHLGVFPEGFANEPKDLNEMTSPVTPHMQAFDAVWPGDVAFAKARAAGVTTVCVLPGSANVVSGTGVALRTVGRDVERMARRNPACLKVAFGHNVKHSHGVKRGRAPLTRMAIAALFREAFEGALRYEQARILDPGKPSDPANEVLLLALRRDIPVRAHASRSDDILTACRLARQFGLRLIIEHGYEAHLVLDQVKAAGAAVVFGPGFRNCGHSEELHFDFAQTKLLDDAGVRVAHMTDHPIVPVGYLPLQAGLSVRAGMAPDRALRLITSHAAAILGLEKELGRLAPGLAADLVILDGPPLEVASRVRSTWIDGEIVYRAGDPLPVPGAAFA